LGIIKNNIMKVILTKNIPSLGQAGDIKEVKDGFWRNHLLPQGLAVVATPALIKEVDLKEKVESQKRVKKEDEITKTFSEISGKTFTVTMNADEKGTLFVGLDSKKISQLLNEETGIALPENVFDIKKPIKEIGLYEIKAGEVSFNLQINRAK